MNTHRCVSSIVYAVLFCVTVQAVESAETTAAEIRIMARDALMRVTTLNAKEIVGKDEIRVGNLTWYTVRGLSATSSIAWFPSPHIQAGPPHIQDGHALFFSKHVGEYTISAFVVDWEAKTLFPLSKTVRVSGEGPAPPDPPIPPDPNPPIPPDPPDPDPPDPDPPIPKGNRYIVISEESSQRTREFVNLLQQIHVFREYCETNKHIYLLADQDSNSPAVRPYAQAAQTDNVLPCLFIVPGKGGKLLYKGSVPTTVEELIQLVQKYGG